MINLDTVDNLKQKQSEEKKEKKRRKKKEKEEEKKRTSPGKERKRQGPGTVKYFLKSESMSAVFHFGPKF